MGSRKGVGRRSKLGSAFILKSRFFQWMVQDYGAFGFGTGSFCSISSSSNFSSEGLTDWFLIFLILLALWLFLLALKLESIEVGLSKWLSSNFSFNPHFNSKVLLAK